MNLSERCGLFLGYLLGIFTGIISFVRGARMFHPRGQLFEANVESNVLSPHAMVRLSSAWWKNKEWKDVLGIAIRFSATAPDGEKVKDNDQDLLFASFPKWWMTPIGPFITHHHDFLRNHYYTVAGFSHEGRLKIFKLIPKNITILKGTRREKLLEAVLEGEAVFLLMEKIDSENHWNKLAEIKLKRTLHFDQETLRFNPFQSGQGIKPAGFLQHLRIGAYYMSQMARPSSGSD